MARNIASALTNGTNNGTQQMNAEILRQLQQLATTTRTTTNPNPLSNQLASIHTQMLKQELVCQDRDNITFL